MYHYAANNPVKYTDPDGREVTIKVYILDVENKIFGKTANGFFIAFDNDTGELISGDFRSGGRPCGNPIPEGYYDILSKTNVGYRLEALDENYGDDEVEGTGKSNLRLHKLGKGRTTGCISVLDDECWAMVENLIKNTKTSKTEVKSKSRNPLNFGKMEPQTKYGTLTVIDLSYEINKEWKEICEE